MSGNEIGSEGAKAVSEMLEVNKTIKTLNLGCEKESNKEKVKGNNDNIFMNDS